MFNQSHAFVAIVTLICFVIIDQLLFHSSSGECGSTQRYRFLVGSGSGSPSLGPTKGSKTSSSLSDRQSEEIIRCRLQNRLITDCDRDVAAQVRKLAQRKAPGNDPELVNLARQLIDLPRALAAKFAMRPRATVQSTVIDSILKNMIGGKFVECGAYDGEIASPTVYLEKFRGWTGLLVEADPGYYAQLRAKQRNAYSINACLSPQPHFTQMNYKFSGGQLGVLDFSPIDANLSRMSIVPCFPLHTLLLALNWTTIDFFSLDVEGTELEILKTVPWDQFNVRTLAVEFRHGKEGRAGYTEYMKSQGYNVSRDLIYDDVPLDLHIYDLIFVKNNLK